MRHAKLTSTLSLLLITIMAVAQEPFVISGTIYDSTSHQALSRASIHIKGGGGGTTAGDDGSFHLKTTQRLPLTLEVSSIGFKTQEFVVSQESSQNLSLNLNVRN